MLKNPAHKIPLRMFLYGMAYGSLMSALVFIALHLSADWSLGYLWTFLHIGTIFGGLAGLFSGTVIMIGVGVFPSRNLTSNIGRPYQISIGIITVFISGIILLAPFGGLSFITHNTSDIPLIGFLTSIWIATYASQRTFTKYLRESDVRKKKVDNSIL